MGHFGVGDNTEESRWAVEAVLHGAQHRKAGDRTLGDAAPCRGNNKKKKYERVEDGGSTSVSVNLASSKINNVNLENGVVKMTRFMTEKGVFLQLQRLSCAACVGVAALA